MAISGKDSAFVQLPCMTKRIDALQSKLIIFRVIVVNFCEKKDRPFARILTWPQSNQNLNCFCLRKSDLLNTINCDRACFIGFGLFCNSLSLENKNLASVWSVCLGQHRNRLCLLFLRFVKYTYLNFFTIKVNSIQFAKRGDLTYLQHINLQSMS